jgi:hypothetical protein
MKHNNSLRENSDITEHFEFLRSFLNLTPEEVETIHEVADRLEPALGRLMDDIYDQLTRYDCTLRHFARPQTGYEGEVPDRLEEITPDHPLMLFRKQATFRYFLSLVSRPLNLSMVQYMDWLGRIHHSKAGASKFSIPVVQLESMMGSIMVKLTQAIYSLGLPQDKEELSLRGLQKLLWIQNGFLLRHSEPTVRE